MEIESFIQLEQLKGILNEHGCLKSSDDAMKLIQHMDILKTVAGKCLVISILSTTAFFSKSHDNVKDLLTRFLVSGGWASLSNWFKESVELKQFSLLTEIVETVTLFPITVDLLKASSIPKLLKTVAKFEFKPLQISARKLLITWKKFVKNKNEEKNKNEPPEISRPIKGPSFLDSLAAAMNSSENSRKRRVNADMSNVKKPPNQTDRDFLNRTENIKEINHKSSDNVDCVVEVETSQHNDLSGQSPSKRRSVSFKDDSLVEIFYFEMTNQERLEMHGERTQLQFNEARHLDSLEEKNAIKNAKAQNEDKDMSHEWSKSALLEEILSLEKGAQSEEKDNQSLRESNILAPIFVEKTRIPDCPSEPPPNDSTSKTDIELSLNNGPHESSVICIPYWENFVYPPALPRKMFYPPISDNIRDNFINRGRYKHNAVQFSRNPGYRPPFRPKTYRPRNEFNNTIHQSSQPRAGLPRYDGPSPYNRFPRPHSYERPTQKLNDPQPLLACRHFLKGKCHLGNNCRFKHDNDV